MSFPIVMCILVAAFIVYLGCWYLETKEVRSSKSNNHYHHQH